MGTLGASGHADLTGLGHACVRVCPVAPMLAMLSPIVPSPMRKMSPCRFPTRSSISPASRRIRWPRVRARRARRTSRGRSRRAADSRSGSIGCPTCWPRRISRRSCRGCSGRSRQGGGIIWGFGAHVIKTGLSPILIDLMRRGFVSALATNGAGIIHDFEIAIGGATSEDVDETLGPGRFGMAEETGRVLNDAIAQGVKRRPRHRARPSGAYLRGSSPAHVSSEHRRRRQRARHPADGARRDRHRHHPHASGGLGIGARRGEPARLSLLRVERGAPRTRRLPELRIGRRPSRGVPEGGGARAEPGPPAHRPHDRQPRFRAPVPAADERRLAARRRGSAWATR